MYALIENFVKPAYNYCFPTYLSVDELLTERPHITIESVSQHKAYSKLAGYDGGVCGGLSTMHILKQLQSKETTNPFNQENNYKQSLEVQTKNSDVAHRWKYPTHLKYRLPNGKELINIQVNNTSELQEHLEICVKNSQKDKYARGVLFFSDIRRNPYDGSGITGNHAYSLTVQQVNGIPTCTALDSNLFFARAEGMDGCMGIAKLLADTASAYNPSKTYLSVVTCDNAV